MKAIRFISITATILLLAGCSYVKYNKVFSSNDEFTNEKRSMVRIRLWPEEKYNDINEATMICEGVSKGEARMVRFYFSIPRTLSGFRVKDEGFIKVGGNKYKVIPEEPVSMLRHDNDVSISMFAASDSTGSRTRQTTDIDSRTWVEEKFMITVAENVLNDMGKADNMLFRFYFGPVTITFPVKGFKYDLVAKAAGVK